MAEEFEIDPTRQFRFGGRRISFDRRANDPARSYIFRDQYGIDVAFTHAELVDARATNQLREWTPDPETPAEGELPRPARRSHGTANGRELFDGEWHLAYCMAWAERPGTSRSAPAISPIIDEVYERRRREAQAEMRYEPPKPCPSAVLSWIAKWLAGGRKIDALIGQHSRKGNRRCKLRHDMHSLLVDFVDKHYLSSKRLSAAEVHRKLVDHVDKLNEKRPLTDRIVAPSYDAVLHQISKLCKFTIDYCRRGPAYAKEHWRKIRSGLVTERANEVWEIDDTRADVILLGKDKKTVIGRPWLVVVIDRHTRMIMAVVLSFNPPDTHTALEALKMAIKGKEALLRRYPGIRGDYPARGTRAVVHVDNAKHYNSEALTKGLARLGVGHRTMPVLKAWYKGTVERIIGTISRQVFHTVPGTTYSGIYERDRETPPELVAEATLDEMKEKLLRWVVHEYQHRHHKGIDDTPYAMWKCSLAAHPQPLPHTDEEVDAALSLTVGRTVGRGGHIHFRNLVYESTELARIRIAPKAQKLREVVIRVDREDLTSIEYLHPVSGEWRPAKLLKMYRQRVLGRSLDEYDLACALRRSRPDEFGDNDPEFKATYAETDKAVEVKAASPKQSERTKAEAARERMFKQADRADQDDEAVHEEDGEDLSSRVERELAGSTDSAATLKSVTPEDAKPVEAAKPRVRRTPKAMFWKKRED